MFRISNYTRFLPIRQVSIGGDRHFGLRRSGVNDTASETRAVSLQADSSAGHLKLIFQTSSQIFKVLRIRRRRW